MTSETILFILFLLSFVILGYNVVILIKRKEYENSRIFNGYNILIFGVVLLGLAVLVKTIKFGMLTFYGGLGYLIYLDIISNLILIPLFGISYLVAMFSFKEV